MEQNINVDIWGLKSIKNKNECTYEIHIMNMVDPVTKEKRKRKNSLFIVLSLVAALLFPRSVFIGLKDW